ncbi:hypothetical protein KAW08_06675 [bacterium]|nr:hypothetical protein [bacterium]
MRIAKREYQKFLVQIKSRIQTARTKAVLSVNAELIYLYWDIGQMIEKRQKAEGWGAGIIPNLSKDIHNEMPEIKGFSERNLKRMIRFFREYPNLSILQQPVAKIEKQKKVPQPVAQLDESNISFKLQQLVAKLPWGHNILLIEKVEEVSLVNRELLL